MEIALVVPALCDTDKACSMPPLPTALRALGHSVRLVAADRIASLAESFRIVADGEASERIPDDVAARATALVHAAEAEHPEAARRFARIIASSPQARDQLVRAGPAESEVALVEPGSDPAPRSPGSHGGSCRLLALGASTPRSGHALLLRALARLTDLDWQLTLADADGGDFVHSAELDALIAELAIEGRVTMQAEGDAVSLARAWAAADLFVSASDYEPHGAKAAAALRHGIPAIVTAGGAAGAPLVPETGAVCPVGDRDTLSKTLRRLIFDAGLRHDLAEAAWHAGASLPDWPTQARAFAAALGPG